MKIWLQSGSALVATAAHPKGSCASSRSPDIWQGRPLRHAAFGIDSTLFGKDRYGRQNLVRLVNPANADIVGTGSTVLCTNENSALIPADRERSCIPKA